MLSGKQILGPGGAHVDDHSDLVDAFLTASRALVAISVRSVDEAQPEVTLAQHRILVLLDARGPQRIGDLSSDLRVDPSVVTRHCDRLQRAGLVARHRDEDDRRAVRVSLTAAGTARLDSVSAARRAEVSRILRAMPSEHHAHVLGALRAFSAAAGEPETSRRERARSASAPSHRSAGRRSDASVT